MEQEELIRRLGMMPRTQTEQNVNISSSLLMSWRHDVIMKVQGRDTEREATVMTKREIMVRAHEVARTMEGDYAARMSYGLRRAWFEARLIAKGGRLWEKAGMRRLYFNNLAELYGLTLEFYNTG